LKVLRLIVLALLFTVVFLNAGLVILVVADGCGPTPPVADFTYSPPFPFTNEAVLFDGSTSRAPNGFIDSYTWNFDDGNVTLTLQSQVVHFCVVPGAYNVSLLVTDELGFTGSTRRTVVVKTRVSAFFSYSPPDPLVGESVAFDASNSSVSDGVIASYAWDFGDGNKTSVSGPFITHSFFEAEEYNVTLTVTGTSGESAATFQIVKVVAPPTVPPQAAFTWFPSTPQVVETVEFDASSSTAGSGNITIFAWGFGDGTAQTDVEAVVLHVYAGFGNYLVSLNVTNSDGLSDVVNHSITVVEKPVADFFWGPSQPRVCTPVTFNGSISDPRGGSLVSFEWLFGDNQTGKSGEVVTHRFMRRGEYVVSLNVTDSEGLWDVKNVTITVLRHIADLNEDDVVNILDLAIFGKAFGSSPGSARWNPLADLDGNGMVNILDGSAIARSYNMCAAPFDP
jgi:PKD repeat protein